MKDLSDILQIAAESIEEGVAVVSADGALLQKNGVLYDDGGILFRNPETFFNCFR